MENALRIAIPVPDAAKFKNYFDALIALGARPCAVDVNVDPSDYDGLLLPGGGDVDPSRYHQSNDACIYVDPALDLRQFAALDAFVRAKKPVLGICRGHQVVNVYFGGTLIQHLPQSAAHSHGPNEPDRVHATTAEAGSVLCGLYGPEFSVNSSHHQGVDAVGKGLRVTQRSLDGVVEGMEHEELPVLCVQWHPERMCFAHARQDTVDGSLIMNAFLELARKH